MSWLKGAIMGVCALILLQQFVTQALTGTDWVTSLLIWALPALAGFAVLWYMLDRAFKGKGGGE